MILFFRKIRQKLIEQSKVRSPASPAGRYFLYAIGEIFLVVIGILIALSINNWNEQRKFKIKEKDILHELTISLDILNSELTEVITSNKLSLKRLYKLDSIVSSQSAYNASIDILFGSLPGWSSPHLKSTVYENLKLNGLDIISNSSLKLDISRLFEHTLVFLVDDYDKAEWSYYNNAIVPFVSKHIRDNVSEIEDYTMTRHARPVNYEELIQNPELLTIIRNSINNRKDGLSSCIEALNKIKQLNQSILEELNTL